MVTHDSRKNRHCAVEKNKAENTSTLLENSLKTNYYHWLFLLLFMLSVSKNAFFRILQATLNCQFDVLLLTNKEA